MRRLSCREVTRLVSQGEDRRLALGERLALRLHFAICEGCRNVSAQLGFLRVAMKRLAERDGDGGR
jgi:hypothetical protein